MTMEYSVTGSDEVLTLTDTVTAHFDRHRQLAANSDEAGGQLFARFDGRATLVQRSTGPRRSDRRTRLTFLPNRLAERREIKRLFRVGLHYVGDWHTHPEVRPSPSQLDIDSSRELVRLSQHELMGLVLIIVGTDPSPEGLFVSIVRDDGLQELSIVRIHS